MEYTKKVVIAVSIGAVAILLLLFLWQVSAVILLAFVGVLLGVFLRGTAKLLSSRTPISTRGSLLIVLALFLALGALAITLAGPRIIDQVSDAASSFPALIDDVRKQLGKYGWGQFLVQQMRSLAPQGEELLLGAQRIFSTAGWILTGTLVVLFVGLYTALAPTSYWNGILALVPMKHQKKARHLRDEMELQLQRWLIGRAVAMTGVGILTFIGLMLLDMPLALTLAVLAGLFDFIPNIGPIISAIPAVLFALAISPQLALSVIILYAVVQLIENYIISPLVERRAVHLPPGFVLVFQLAMGIVFGFLGLLVATPLAVLAIVLIKNLYVPRVNRSSGSARSS